MDRKKHDYTPPLVLTTTGVIPEMGFMTHSVATILFFDTSAQDMIEMDYAADDDYFENYNYKWE